MSPATTRQLSRDEYIILLQQASGKSDFVHVGTVGEGPGRGTWSGFSYGAVQNRVLYPGDTDSDGIARLAEDMETEAGTYAGYSVDLDCLAGGLCPGAATCAHLPHATRAVARRRALPVAGQP